MTFPFVEFQFTEYFLINIVLNICFFMMATCLILCTYRLIKGPTVSDRIISGDAISCCVMALIVLYGVMQNTIMYMPAVLVTALLGFLGMIAMGKYITNGNIMYPMYQSVRTSKKHEKEREKSE
ncbi:MAG: hypothetical protein LBU41_02290 [Clostridiales Family XIII bacterium]|jgi:multisubunit Na+/H+ antiporter MnhF subunit|nr:hypothetical protein [Clostridiales Family XIII bacterium]